ncbi:MAG: hypothetical protein ACJ8CB_13745 [Ktedonobacteraceae bacterium]
MNNTMNNLPKGLALVETADGRWFPALAPLTKTSGWVALVGGTDIPPAITLPSHPRRGYRSRQEALEACWAWYEAASLPIHWRALAAKSEIYPERNAWYRDEIERLTEDTPTLRSLGGESYALVFARAHGVMAAIGSSPDEALEVLYQEVSAFFSCAQPEEVQRRAS